MGELKGTGGGRYRRLHTSLRTWSPLRRKEKCVMGGGPQRAFQWPLTSSTKKHTHAHKKTTLKIPEAIVAKCQHELNWSGRQKVSVLFPVLLAKSQVFHDKRKRMLFRWKGWHEWGQRGGVIWDKDRAGKLWLTWKTFSSVTTCIEYPHCWGLGASQELSLVLNLNHTLGPAFFWLS